MNSGERLYRKAKGIIPGGTQLLSKRPEIFLPNHWPSYYSRAKGCKVWDLDGNEYYDVSICGVGACVLGYANDDVDKAAIEGINNGVMCTLNAPEEVYLAEMILDVHPWADMIRYAKTGGEAMAIAIRIARACTKKDIVLTCGYHGWHDWYLAANLEKGDPLSGVHLKGLEPDGVPDGLKGTNYVFHYNNYEEYEYLLRKYSGKIACVVMEPIRNDYPEDNFLKKIRETTMNENIVLIFDEITAGYRLCEGGSHLILGCNPDMAVFAKAMTNGYPLSAIIGKKDVMEAAQGTFISSTFWTERVSLCAAIKSIEVQREKNVWSIISERGKLIQETWRDITERYNVPLTISGIYPLSHFSFDLEKSMEYKTYFTQEMLKKGFLASNCFYVNICHDEDVLNKYFKSFEEVIEKIGSILDSKDDISNHIEEVCHSGFERLN